MIHSHTTSTSGIMRTGQSRTHVGREAESVYGADDVLLEVMPHRVVHLVVTHQQLSVGTGAAE